jgi:hypothetical protein
MTPHAPRKLLRCAIYTRKSTEHNLDLEFNSLDAQREAYELLRPMILQSDLGSVLEGDAACPRLWRMMCGQACRQRGRFPPLYR